MERKFITILDNEPFLRQRSKEVDFKDKDLKEELEDLEKYCMSIQCLALASVQIGIPKRIMYLRNTTRDRDNYNNPEYNEAKLLINPIIIEKRGITSYWEKCVSCIEMTGLVKRPYSIDIKYQDENGDMHERTLEGFEATVFSHEYDHLDGILHIDIAEEIIEISKEELKKYREKYPYTVISVDGDFKELVKNI